jgi:transposase
MRSTPNRQTPIYHTFNVEDLIEAEHPLRPIKRMVDETLLKSLLLQCLYTVRSERELCRRIRTDLLLR